MRAIILLFVLLFALGPAANAGQCQLLLGKKREKHLTAEETAILLEIQDAIVSDTTGLRKERKLVVPKKAAAEFLKRMTAAFGARLKIRVDNLAGYEGVTETVYPENLKFTTPSGLKRNVKIRVRGYLNQGRATGERVRSAFTKTAKFVELKFEHFQYSQVIVKDRSRLPDEMIEWLADPAALKSKRAEIEAAANADPENKGASISKILDFLAEIQNERGPGRLAPDIVISYKRESFKIPLIDAEGRPILDNEGKQSQIEITVDRDIEIFEAGSSVPAYKFPKNVSIVELKVPLQFGELTDIDLAAVPDLQ
ncbi:MAG: hypothetical protein ABL958_20920, partial [Bdellovibrionia bacterium]